ncbi:MAG: uroporphyrinogen-III C-methyltransferase [Proteobacteria bacterium]|nr:uroporphyrinogen-III C-methyltransferase [Pseudomonadota bacterium]
MEIKDKDQKSQENKAQESKVQGNKEISKKPVSVDKTKPKSTNKLFFILSVLFFIIFSAAFLFVNNRVTRIEKDINQTSIKNDSVVNNIESRIKDTLSRFTGIQKLLEELESKQDVLSHSLSQPIEQQIHINEDYALAEVEHLLIIASYNLQLGHDVATALSAMEAADARLNGLRDPAVLSVREQLNADMNELRSLNQADLSGLGLFLSDLISRIDNLSLKVDVVLEKSEVSKESNEGQVKGLKRFFILVRDELKTFFYYSNNENIGKALLLPDEIYYLKANLKLELANARFAVFNRDTDNFHASISHIQIWINDYFDLPDADVQNIYDSLSRMKNLGLAFPDLDISSSLESVRALIRFQDEENGAVNEENLMPLQ